MAINETENYIFQKEKTMFKKYFIAMLVVFMTIIMSTTVLAKENLNKKKTYGERFVEKLEKDLMSDGGSPKVEIKLIEDDDDITVYSYYSNRDSGYTEDLKFVIDDNVVTITGIGRVGTKIVEADMKATVDREAMLDNDTTIAYYVGEHCNEFDFNKR